MKVKVEFILETPDYGETEFRKEIEAMIKDIDPSGKSKVLTFSMNHQF